MRASPSFRTPRLPQISALLAALIPLYAGCSSDTSTSLSDPPLTGGATGTFGGASTGNAQGGRSGAGSAHAGGGEASGGSAGGTPSSTPAATCQSGATAPAATFMTSNSVGKFKLYMPEGVCKARCVYLHPLEEQYDFTTDSSAQSSARSNGCALLQIEFTISIGDWHNATRGGSGQGTADALTALASSSGHPELARAPWAALGFSAGGAFVTSLSQEFPERTIAVLSWHGGWGVTDSTPQLPAILKVPVLFFGGLCDSVDQWPTEQANWQSLRLRGAPAALALELIGHSPQNCGNLSWPYLNAIVPLRVQGTPAADGSLSLHEIDPMSGVLGNNVSGDAEPAAMASAEDAAQRSWLPNADFAAQWQAFITDPGTHNGSNGCKSGPQPPR